jgi:hypothetical protein
MHRAMYHLIELESSALIVAMSSLVAFRKFIILTSFFQAPSFVLVTLVAINAIAGWIS